MAAQAHSTPIPDVLSGFLPLAEVTDDIRRRLCGDQCARCGTPDPLRPGGFAYTLSSPDRGALGWPVRVCPACPPAEPPERALESAITWARSCGVPETAARSAWNRGESVPATTSRRWSAVRLPHHQALAVLAVLRRHVAAVGPVIEVPEHRAVEFLTGPAHAGDWPPGTLCPSAVCLPGPGMNPAAGWTARCGRRWLTRLEPARTPLTPAETLRAALAAARAQQPHLPPPPAPAIHRPARGALR